MKVLLIGGTGRISMAVSRALLERGDTLYLLNRGNRNSELEDAVILQGDIHEEASVRELIAPYEFDAVADFIAFTPEDVERDYRLFAGKTKQYVFISSATVYQKPPASYLIKEDMPLSNPFWGYAQNKIACEECLQKHYREDGFPVTIIRPSHTYDERSIPVGIHGAKGSWPVIQRIREGKPIIIHGDGQSLWTMTHNSDFAKAFIGILGRNEAVGEAFHITSDESLTWNQIYETLADVICVTLNAVHISTDFLVRHNPYDLYGSLLGDKANTVVFDNSKIKSFVPEFHAEMSLAEGMKEAYEYMLSHPQTQKEDPEFDAWCDSMIAAVAAADRFLEEE